MYYALSAEISGENDANWLGGKSEELRQSVVLVL